MNCEHSLVPSCEKCLNEMKRLRDEADNLLMVLLQSAREIAAMRQHGKALAADAKHADDCGVKLSSLGSSGYFLVQEPCTCGLHDRVTAAHKFFQELP